MNIIQLKSNQKQETGKNSLSLLRNEQGVIDLASIMVGVIVIGMIGGVIATTIFAVIPWAQDNAAKQQLDAIVTAESAHMGFSAVTPSTLPAGSRVNSYGDSVELENSSLLMQGKTYCVIETPDGKGYNAYSQSASGKVFTATDKQTKPYGYGGTLPAECQFIADSYTGPPAPYVDPTPKLTILTYQCDTTTTGRIGPDGNLNGTETWSDGITVTYAGADVPTNRTLEAGVTYTVTFDGTYKFFGGTSRDNLSQCIRSMDHWGMDTGVINASSAFYDATNLVSVPAHIPATIKDIGNMFGRATIINSPNISKWNISNATNTTMMFADAKMFNQPLNSWNMSNVTNSSWMFYGASSFNQPLNNWNTSKVTSMSLMFNGASSFNQDLNSWNVSNVIAMNGMFSQASSFNQPLNNWDVSQVESMNAMFGDATVFNQPLNNWNTSKVTALYSIFSGASAFNQDINNWDVSQVTNMHAIFSSATSFNQPLNNWKVSQLTSTRAMFLDAAAFNQPLDKWDVSAVTDMNAMFRGAAAFNQNLNSWNVSAVTDMSAMFRGAAAFNQNLNSWNVSNVTRISDMFFGATTFNQPLNNWDVSKVTHMSSVFEKATAFNQPLNNWNTSKVTVMSFMFWEASAFSQDLSSWNTVSVTSSSYFANSTFPPAYLPPGVSPS
jgi:surface protein